MPRRACALCLLACGPKDPDTRDDSSTTADTTSPADTTSASAPTTGDCDTTCPEDQFGFVCLQLLKGEGLDADPTVGTAKIKVTLNYEPCLIDYYTVKHEADAMGQPAGDASPTSSASTPPTPPCGTCSRTVRPRVRSSKPPPRVAYSCRSPTDPVRRPTACPGAHA